jgi:hypothetical protein
MINPDFVFGFCIVKASWDFYPRRLLQYKQVRKYLASKNLIQQTR